MPKIWSERMYKNMSGPMISVIPDLADIKREILYCHLNAHWAHNASDFSLPARGANGKLMTAGDREAIHQLSLYWIARRDTSIKLLWWNVEHDEWFEKNGIPNRAAGHLGELKD